VDYSSKANSCSAHYFALPIGPIVLSTKFSKFSSAIRIRLYVCVYTWTRKMLSTPCVYNMGFDRCLTYLMAPFDLDFQIENKTATFSSMQCTKISKFFDSAPSQRRTRKTDIYTPVYTRCLRQGFDNCLKYLMALRSTLTFRLETSSQLSRSW
jgi:hypothetical protein